MAKSVRSKEMPGFPPPAFPGTSAGMACWSGPAHRVYRGVVARSDDNIHSPPDNRPWDWPRRLFVFEGYEKDLRRAGLLRPEDSVPTGPR
jgi:hypothetical protein